MSKCRPTKRRSDVYDAELSSSKGKSLAKRLSEEALAVVGGRSVVS